MFHPYGREPDSIAAGSRPAPFAAISVILIAGLSVGIPGPASAETRAPLTLSEAEVIALEAEPGREQFESRADAFTARAIVAGQLPEPMLRVGLNNYPIESGGFTTEGMTNAGLGVRQEFPPGRTLEFGARQFESLADEMRFAADARSRNVLAAVRVAWLDVYHLDQSYRLMAETRPLFDDLADVTRSLYSVGRRSQQDVLRAELERSRLDDRLIDLEQRRAAAAAALGEWVGADAARPVAQSLPTWHVVPAYAELESSLGAHPLLEAADAQIAAREAGVALAEQRSRPMWVVDLGYSYRQGSLPDGQPRSDFVSLNVSVGLPFFRQKSVDATLVAALGERSAAKAQREQKRRELARQLQSAHAQWQELSRRLELYDERILVQSRSNAEAAMLAYQSDRGDFADVMRARIDDLNAQLEHVRLTVERARQYVVIANLGGIDP